MTQARPFIAVRWHHGHVAVTVAVKTSALSERSGLSRSSVGRPELRSLSVGRPRAVLHPFCVLLRLVSPVRPLRIGVSPAMRVSQSPVWRPCQSYAPEGLSDGPARAMASGILILCVTGLVGCSGDEPAATATVTASAAASAEGTAGPQLNTPTKRATASTPPGSARPTIRRAGR